MEMRNERPPEALLDNIVTTIQDRFLGFEALALASVVERPKHTAAIEKLPSIQGIAETPEAKVGIARAWLRCWQNHGFWLSAMPPVWWRRPRSQGTSIRGQKGKFKAMDAVLKDPAARKLFWDKWSPALLAIFTQDSDSGFKRLRGSELSLLFEGEWVHCSSCKSVHRPVPGLGYCSHRVEVEVYVQEGDAAARDTSFDTLIQAIGTALEADPTLGGLAFGMTYGRPSVDVEAVDGAAAIKTGTLAIVVDYETDAPLG